MYHTLRDKWCTYLRRKPMASERGVDLKNHASPTLRFFLREQGVQI